MVWGSGFRVYIRFGVQGLGFRFYNLGFQVKGLGFEA
jgi:hypothetical protein